MNRLSDARVIALKSFDFKGSLVPVDGVRDLPFAIERVFYVSGVEPGTVRGYHAHKRCKQALVCLNGRLQVELDDGTEKKSLTLDSPTACLYVPEGIWASERYLEPGTILLVFTDRTFEPDDYIREYDEFLHWRAEARRGER